jgi:hypothetical protein
MGCVQWDCFTIVVLSDLVSIAISSVFSDIPHSLHGLLCHRDTNLLR